MITWFFFKKKKRKENYKIIFLYISQKKNMKDINKSVILKFVFDLSISDFVSVLLWNEFGHKEIV